MTSRPKIRLPFVPNKLSGTSSLADVESDELKSVVDGYAEIHDGGLAHRKEEYGSLVSRYYDIATDFYEFAWGSSFHFAPRRRGESFKDSITRFQHLLADKLSLKPEMVVLDAGCGVGGPMGTLARYSGASFVGITINAYQIERAKANTQDVESLCRFIHGDFMQIPESDNTFDGAFSIEALCHAPDKVAVLKEIFRVLRPGALFTRSDWCMTEKFDPGSERHQQIKLRIERGGGIADLAMTSEFPEALSAAGFEVLEVRDLAFDSDPETPWYLALQSTGDFSLASISRTTVGRALTNLTLRVGEKVRMFPKGSTAVSTMLNTIADALIASGETGIFTPMYHFLVRKPNTSESK
ncbi:MAG: methyltransferase domain-containing protein [Acidiferrobacterales bacterium]|nr:methyltransferase domain-containing protein [Acidiferrobacterales bacterium]